MDMASRADSFESAFLGALTGGIFVNLFPEVSGCTKSKAFASGSISHRCLPAAGGFWGPDYRDAGLGSWGGACDIRHSALGYRCEIAMAEHVLSEVSTKSGGSPWPLMEALRASLRDELEFRFDI